MKKVITHAGVFHADELLAIALLKTFAVIGTKTPIERKFEVTDEEYNDPKIMVIDVGRRYDPLLANLDHHHDAELPASCSLVLNWLHANGYINSYMWLKLTKISNEVSAVDIGENINPGHASLSRIVNAFNHISDSQGWDKAFDFVKSAIWAVTCQVRDEIDGERRWIDEVEKFGDYAVNNGEYIPGWKEHAKMDDITCLVEAYYRGGWKIESCDTDLFKIPAHETQTFRHNSGFMAVYATKEDALAHVKTFS